MIVIRRKMGLCRGRIILKLFVAGSPNVNAHRFLFCVRIRNRVPHSYLSRGSPTHGDVAGCLDAGGIHQTASEREVQYFAPRQRRHFATNTIHRGQSVRRCGVVSVLPGRPTQIYTRPYIKAYVKRNTTQF